MVNKRNNKIIDLNARLTMTWLAPLPNGLNKGRYAPLSLERDAIFLFPLNWTIVHPITEESPLYGKTKEDLDQMKAEFLILLKGHDETYNQTVHTNSSYISSEISWDVRFKPMYYENAEGTTLEIDKIDAVESA